MTHDTPEVKGVARLGFRSIGLGSAPLRVRPNLHTLSWIGLVGAMGYAGAVGSNGAAYLLAFLTIALGALSFMHARGNLAGLEVKALPGAARADRFGVELRAATGHAACGVEVLLIGASKATFVENLESGQTTRVSLHSPASPNLLSQRLLLRSSYPLGLFNAVRVVELTTTQPRVPKPSGDLPLPLPQPCAGAEGLTTGRGSLSREGDDFAGVREWQPGDSPRHIDWRAVARGRPLMVKTWAQSASVAVPLDWETLSLPAAERAGQLARWIQECELSGMPYSLHLPNQDIAVGLGADQAQRCLRALGELESGALQFQAPVKRGPLPASHEHSAQVAKNPLRLLCGLVMLAALMLLDFVTPVSVGLLGLCMAWRLMLRPAPALQETQRAPSRSVVKSFSQPSSWLPIGVFLIGIAAVHMILGDLFSMEAGIAVLIVLTGAKLVESRTPHDFQVVAMIGWFLCLCGLLTDQGLARSGLMFLIFVGIIGCMVRFRRGSSGVQVPARLTLRLLAQALPAVLLLFLFFPRVSLDYLARLGRGETNKTGVPTSLEPGGVSAIARSSERAFGVEFPTGKVIPNKERYWRCVVLWECAGFKWTRGSWFSYTPHLRLGLPGDIEQIITLEPHGQQWLPALDQPMRGRDGGGLLALYADRTLGAEEPVRTVRRLEVISRPRLGVEDLSETRRQAALQVPADLPVELKDLARQWRAAAKSDGDVVNIGLNYLRTQGFRYTLEPGTYLGPRALHEFLFERRLGFCEHYSAAFATMMRLAGVPSRVVMGYLGGEVSDGGYMIVRQSDAHAWTEVWLPETGWTRIDPTGALAPGRMDLNLQSYLLGDADALERQRNSFIWQGWLRARLLWDQLNLQWYNTVISFNEDNQIEWFSWLGRGQMREAWQLVIIAVSLLLAFGLLSWWLRRPARERDPWALAWRQLCQRLEKNGLPARAQHEGPLAYTRRLSLLRPQLAQPLDRLAHLYAEARYGQGGGSLKEFRRQSQTLPTKLS